MNPSKCTLNVLGFNQLRRLSEFVVTQNNLHHYGISSPNNGEIESIYAEEVRYFNNSRIVVARYAPNGEIVGSIRIMKWDRITPLPIQNIFGINITEDIGTYQSSNIWHIGRFAIRKTNTDKTLFKRIMICALAPVCKEKDSTVYAECDVRLLRVMDLLGIQTTIIGKAISYLGSETIPVRMNFDGLIDFFDNNKGHTSTRELELTQSYFKLSRLTPN